jgi:hypothetical protein
MFDLLLDDIAVSRSAVVLHLLPLISNSLVPAFCVDFLLMKKGKTDVLN